MKNILQKFLFSLSLIWVLVGAPAFAAEPEAPPEVFDVQQFWKHFEDDHEKANQTFIGKTIVISGIVVDTGISIYLTPNVRLSDKPEGNAYIVCVLPRSETDTLSSYTKGEHVTMTGRVYSSKAGERVVIKQCERFKK